MTRRWRRWRAGSKPTPTPGSGSAVRSPWSTPRGSSRPRSVSTPAAPLDPQLHTHLVIANRVASPDGRWLALDARSIEGRPAHPVGPLSRRAASRADRPARRPLGRTRARDRRDRRRRRGGPGRVLPAVRDGGPPPRRQARPVHRHDGPGADGRGNGGGSSAKPSSTAARPKPTARRRRRAARPVGGPGARPRARPGRGRRHGGWVAGGPPRHRPARHDTGRRTRRWPCWRRGSRRGGPPSWSASSPPPSPPTTALHRRQRGRPGSSESPARWRWPRCVDVSRPVPPGAMLRRDGRPVSRVGRSTGPSPPRRSSTRKPTCSPGPTAASPTPGARNQPPPHQSADSPRRWPRPRPPRAVAGDGRPRAGRRPGRHRQDHRPRPGRRAAPRPTAGSCSASPPRPPRPRSWPPRPASRPTRSTSSSSNTPCPADPITATTSPSAPP